MSCARCGEPVAASDRFCAACGAPVAADGEDHTETHPAVEVDVESGDRIGTILVTKGANAGSKFALTDAVTTIGRHPDSGVFLDDVTVSRRHAEIRHTDEGFTLVDSGSLNGTYCNGGRIETVQLAEDDVIQVGRYKLVFVWGVPESDG